MHRYVFQAAALLLACTAALPAAVVRFETEPFANSTALSDPGRQIVGNEDFISFVTATDVFSLDPNIFGLSSIEFVNDVAGNIPASGVNVVVLETLDNDNDPTTPFGAGTAANLIAAQVTSPGPGLFVYFNSGLDMPRLVYSTDLSENTADLKVLARLTNLEGNPGALTVFSAANFELVETVPEPATSALMLLAGAVFAGLGVRRRRQF